MKTTIILFSQNLKLASAEDIFKSSDSGKRIVLTTHYLFPFEREIIENWAGKNSYIEYITFSDLLTDKEMEYCDAEAYRRNPHTVDGYYKLIKEIKNQTVYKNLVNKVKNGGNGDFCGIILSDDLGIDRNVWEQAGFRYQKRDYYYIEDERSALSIIKAKLYQNKYIQTFWKKTHKERYFSLLKGKIHVGYYDGLKYVFMGRLDRIQYRMDIAFEVSDDECARLLAGDIEPSEKCRYITTLHEVGSDIIPDNKRYDVRYIQDGYLPPNYTSYYLRFNKKHIKYYAWDTLGEQMFRNLGESVSIMPFRKKIYIPKPIFPKKVNTVLIATSGAGDWTAIKNRSDEDKMAMAFVELAKRFPEIKFCYRCHPVWVHPQHQGVNSIKRYMELFSHLNLPNLVLSGNIPDEDIGSFRLSLSRESLSKDLENADLVFGEHSVAMVDGALQGIPFASVNFTGRRNLFCGITKLGFPHFESVDEIADFIINITGDAAVQSNYIRAVEKYNSMTDEEDEQGEAV